MAGRHFIELCRRVLILSGLRDGDSMVVVSQGREREDYADAFLSAAASVGAKGFHIRLPDAVSGVDANEGVWEVGRTPLTDRPDVVGAICGTRLLVDLIFLLHSAELDMIRNSGTRVLTCIEPPDVLARLMPTDEMTRAVDEAAALLRNAREMRVTSQLGTDVRFKIGGYPTFAQVGYPREDGDWDHWSSSGMAYTYPDDTGTDGTVVVAPGDIILPFKQYVSEPITYAIDGGVITEIAGGFEADLVRDYMDGFADPHAYAIAHVGWGLNPAARWSALATDRRGHGMEVRAFRGNLLFSTGPNLQAGGPNHARCHLDVPMRGCTVTLGEVVVLDNGVVVT